MWCENLGVLDSDNIYKNVKIDQKLMETIKKR